MAYSQALEEQVALLERVRRSEWMRLEEWHEAAQGTAHMLEDADPYFWGGALCEVIRSAAVELPPSWKWSPEILPTPAGFVWFEKPWGWDTRDMGIAPAAMVAVGWMKFRDSKSGESMLMVVPFIREVLDGRGIVHPFIVLTMDQGETVEEATKRLSKHQNARAVAIGGGALLTIGACLTFLQQRILIAPQHRADRPARRRLEREGYQHEPLIRVVELRRKQSRANHSDDHEAVEWSCQWVVSGHWRNQWYASLNDYQPRWIMPYVKGPEDAPLKPPRAKVFAVTR